MSARRLRPRLPTRRGDWRLMGRTVRLVLGVPTYAVGALATSIVALSAFVVAQNFELARFALVGPLALDDRISILAGVYPFLGTSYGPVTGAALVCVAALAGVDAAMVVYHFREHGFGARESGGSAVGLALGALGAGCAACGSAVLAGVLSLFGAAGAGTFLPLEGLEFSVLALATLVLSVFWVADGMRGGEIRGCPVE
ncbi:MULTISPECIES: hypothetical protein [Halorussus]|uniref:hypothetical protein n=1 Tax=Halorussus TaxID=1070314 RepID=UPI0020A19A96|nr:hypothetical protein [Halorussus vallis]USZ76217.1 hypothetical protein NGM07_02565 [Halorussus vallis]